MEKTAFKERPYFVESYALSHSFIFLHRNPGHNVKTTLIKTIVKVKVKYRTYQIEILSTTNQMNIVAGNLQ